jgi:hypothetical protein
MTEPTVGEFRGDLEGYLEWAKENFAPSPTFCPIHWSPAPVEGRNGIMASSMLMQKMLEQMPSNLKSAASRNRWMQNLQEPFCCMLGDEEMTEIWSKCSVKDSDAES